LHNVFAKQNTIKKLNTHQLPGQEVREIVKNWELEYHFPLSFQKYFFCQTEVRIDFFFFHVLRHEDV